MFNLPDMIISQRNLLERAELLTTKFYHLERLLNLLKNKVLFVRELETEVLKKYAEGHSNAEETVQWIRDNFTKLKKSKWVTHTIIKDTFEIAEAIIFCRPLPFHEDSELSNSIHFRAWHLATSHFYHSNGFVGPALNVLCAITQIIAEFGEVELFKDWAELEFVKKKAFLNKILPGSTTAQIRTMDIAQIAEKTGYGFTKFQLLDAKDSVTEPIILYHQCRFVGLIHTPFVEKAICNFLPEAISKWKESCDTDPATLYQFLKFLSEYRTHNDINPELLKIPTTWEAHELAAVHICRKLFFGSCSSKDQKNHPITSQDLMKFVDKFLNMIELETLVESDNKLNNNKRSGRPNKNKTKSFIENSVKDYLFSLGKNIDLKELKSNEMMYLHITDIAHKNRTDCLTELTKPLVEKIYRDVLKKNGIHRKGGAPNKRKPPKKPLTNS